MGSTGFSLSPLDAPEQGLALDRLNAGEMSRLCLEHMNSIIYSVYIHICYIDNTMGPIDILNGLNVFRVTK